MIICEKKSISICSGCAHNNLPTAHIRFNNFIQLSHSSAVISKLIINPLRIDLQKLDWFFVVFKVTAGKSFRTMHNLWRISSTERKTEKRKAEKADESSNFQMKKIRLCICSTNLLLGHKKSWLSAHYKRNWEKYLRLLIHKNNENQHTSWNLVRDIRIRIHITTPFLFSCFVCCHFAISPYFIFISYRLHTFSLYFTHVLGSANFFSLFKILPFLIEETRFWDRTNF